MCGRRRMGGCASSRTTTEGADAWLQALLVVVMVMRERTPEENLCGTIRSGSAHYRFWPQW